MANPCVPWVGGYSSSVDYWVSGAVYIGFTPYPRSNVEHYWWSNEHPKTQWAMNSQFAGSGSLNDSWGLYQTTIPSTYGQFNYWTCSGKAGDPDICCPKLTPGVSYNTKMLIVWDSWNQGQTPFGSGVATPIFWQASSSGTAPCDMDYNDYGSYPFGQFSETIAEICGLTYTQSITESIDGNWEDGLVNFFWSSSIGTTTYSPSTKGGIIILKNNDVRGVDLFQVRQRWNPRLYNCWPPFNKSLATTGIRAQLSLTPMRNTYGTPSPFDDPYNYKPILSWDPDGWNPPGTEVSFSYDACNGVQTSESFDYNGDTNNQPYGWQTANYLPGAYQYGFEQQTGSMTIEMLIKPAQATKGIRMENLNGIPNTGGSDENSAFVVGNWMPLITKQGYLGEYSVYVDTYESKSIAFGYSNIPGYWQFGTNPGKRVWFTTPMDTIGIKDAEYDWNQWVHICVTRNFELKTLPDGTQQTPYEQLFDYDCLKWYINGEPVVSMSLDDFEFTTSTILPDLHHTNYSYDSGSYLWNLFKQRTWYSGSAGFTRIYDRALNQYQVKTNFLRSGIWTDFQGYGDEIDFIYNALNPQTDEYEDVQVKYTLNGGVPCSLQVMFDHGNLVSDHGMNNTTQSFIRNIRQYSSSFDGTFSGSDFGPGGKFLTDMYISQSVDSYQTYDSMNGARFFPGSDGTDPASIQYAYLGVEKVYSIGKAKSKQTVEMWIRLSSDMMTNAGYTGHDKVIFCNGSKNENMIKATADWGLMYNYQGFGFWDGDVHYGIPWSACAHLLKDRWCYVQAVFNRDGWNNTPLTGRGKGMVIGLNGQYWRSGSEVYDENTDLTPLDGINAFNNVNSPWFGEISSSLYFMGHWEHSEEYNASGSIAEIRFYNTDLEYTGSASYAFGPDWGSGCVNQGGDVPCTESLDRNADTPYNWLEHNWNASKVRFGMGGDKSWT